MRFVRSEWVPGTRAVFERSAGYVPRAQPASWLTGGKRILADRIIFLPAPVDGLRITYHAWSAP